MSGRATPRNSERRGWRRVRHALKPRLTRPLQWLAERTLPRLFVIYMRLVWATSRIEVNDFPRAHEIGREHGGFVGLVFHEEVLMTAYGYPQIGLQLHTVASVGDAGAVIARALELCGFHVFRGGTASRASRRRPMVLRAMIKHMQARDDVLYGITVDGSKGPAYMLKGGSIAIARACKKPIIHARIWSSRTLRLKTWDRTAIPLPFGTIEFHLRGPFFAPDASEGRARAEQFRLQMECELIELAGHSHDSFSQPRPPELLAAAERNAGARKAL